MTFWEKAEKFPPVLVRLLARHKNGPPLTNEEIASRSGLSPIEVLVISQQLDWKGVDLPTMQRFLGACGIDLEDRRHMKRVDAYLRGKIKSGIHVPPPFEYLKKSPDWATFYEPLGKKFLTYGSKSRGKAAAR